MRCCVFYQTEKIRTINEGIIYKSWISLALDSCDNGSGFVRRKPHYYPPIITKLVRLESRIDNICLSINETKELIGILLLKPDKPRDNEYFEVVNFLQVKIANTNTVLVFSILDSLIKHNLFDESNFIRICKFSNKNETLKELETNIARLIREDIFNQISFDCICSESKYFNRSFSYIDIDHIHDHIDVPIKWLKYSDMLGNILDNKDLMINLYKNKLYEQFMKVIMHLLRNNMLNNIYIEYFVEYFANKSSEKPPFHIYSFVIKFIELIKRSDSMNCSITNFLKENQKLATKIIDGVCRLEQVRICNEENIAIISKNPIDVSEHVNSIIKAHLKLDEAKAHNIAATFPKEIWAHIFNFCKKKNTFSIFNNRASFFNNNSANIKFVSSTFKEIYEEMEPNRKNLS